MHGGQSLRGIAIVIVIVTCPLITKSERATAALSASHRVSGLLVSGNRLYLNGHLFTPKGFNLVAALYSKQCYYDYLRNAARHFTAREMKVMTSWDINTIRLQVSQTALTDARHRTGYVQEIKSDVRLAHRYGFTVILTVTDYRYRPCGAAVGYPIKQTVTAWRFLAPQFKADPDVAFELFNEATGGTTENDWQLWRYGGGKRVGMQALVNVIRDSGVENVIIAGGTARAETFEHIGVSRLLHEVGRGGRGIAYAIHAYQFEKDYNARIGKSVRWNQRFGFLTTRVPVIATEWHFGPAGCRIQAGNPASSEAIAPALFRYLDRHNIGLLAWAFDVSNTIVVTNGTNWTWQPTRCGSRYQGAGQVLRQWFVGKY